ncbi:MAG: hypothetical protein KJ630_10920 [Proteobacteria bacterium]|nr:hypothetical protein [Pseudomonadota bacterium]
MIKFSRVKFFFLICCTTVFSLTAAANAANIVAFGDSTTAGDPSNITGYAPKLETLLNNNGKPSVVANYGLWSENTYGGVNRIDSVLAAFAANFILIMEGTNDIRGGISVETTKFNLQTMISKAKTAKVTPALSTLTPSSLSGSETLIPQVWNPMIIALASSNGIKLADNYTATLPTWGTNNNDGIHPNAYSQQVMADTWYAVIAPMISSSGAVSGSGGGGNSSGCFIATAAFGSPTEKHVTLLKEFRDTCLLTNSLGRQFVEAYYHYSPPVAEFIGQHENVKLLVRVLLYPLITLCYLLLKLSLPVQLALAAFVTATACLVLSTFVIRRNCSRNA